MTYRTIKINDAGDAATELDELPELLKHNKLYCSDSGGWDYSLRECVEIAISELYEKLKAEQRAGINQRNLI